MKLPTYLRRRQSVPMHRATSLRRHACATPAAQQWRITQHAGLLRRADRIIRGIRAAGVINRSRPMGEAEPDLVRNLMLKAHTHLEMLCMGSVPANDAATHDYLAHIVAISQIRVIQIGAADSNGIGQANELLAVLNEAARGLMSARQRHEKAGRWGLDGPALEPMRESLGIYEDILRASSPLQMEHAQNLRVAEIKRLVASTRGKVA